MARAQVLQHDELLDKIKEEIIIPIKNAAQNKDAHNMVALLKSLSVTLSLSEYTGKEVFERVTDSFQEIDQNFYSQLTVLIGEPKLIMGYAINDKEFFERAKELAIKIDGFDIENFGRSGKYGGIGFAVYRKKLEDVR